MGLMSQIGLGTREEVVEEIVNADDLPDLAKQKVLPPKWVRERGVAVRMSREVAGAGCGLGPPPITAPEQQGMTPRIRWVVDVG